MVDNIFIGQMDRQVIIYRKENIRSGTGGFTESLVSIATPWAKMEEVSGKQDEEGKIVHLVDRKYFTRYRSDLLGNSTNLVLEDKDQKFEVLHVMEIGRKNKLEFRVKRYE